MGPIAVAAYSYMALVPIIQPPIMKLFTTKKERAIKMENLRPVSKLERILFPIVVTIVVCLILPTTAPLVGMLMLGNLFRESGVVRQLSETASNALTNRAEDTLELLHGKRKVFGKNYTNSPNIQELICKRCKFARKRAGPTNALRSKRVIRGSRSCAGKSGYLVSSPSRKIFRVTKL